MEDKTIKQIITEKYSDLTATGKQLGKFIIDNYQQTMILSSVELSEAAGVSHSAVIRFTKALGFSGFIEYKNKMKLEYTPTQKVYSSLNMMSQSNTSNGTDFIDMYFTKLLPDINNFVSHLDKSKLDSFCEIMAQADTIYLLGIGSDEVTTKFLRNYFNVMGFKCIEVSQEGLMLRENLFQIGNNDVLFHSAYPTLLDDEKWAIEYAKSNGATVLLMTDSEITAKVLHVDNFICVRETSDMFFNSYVLPMMFCNALLFRMYELNKDSTTEYMKKYHDMLNKY